MSENKLTAAQQFEIELANLQSINPNIEQILTLSGCDVSAIRAYHAYKPGELTDEQKAKRKELVADLQREINDLQKEMRQRVKAAGSDGDENPHEASTEKAREIFANMRATFGVKSASGKGRKPGTGKSGPVVTLPVNPLTE